MNVAGGGLFVIGLLYLAFFLGIVVAIVLAVWSLVRGASALERIASALEKKPPA
jgi:uncharacterized membrane protein